MHSRRTAQAAALLAVLVIAAGIYAVSSSGTEGSATPAVVNTPQVDPGNLASLPAGSRLLVRGVDTRASRADGALYEITRTGAKKVSKLVCKRVYATPGRGGLCLTVAADGSSYDGVVFDRDYEPVRRFPVEGIPDRSRISPDGRYAAFTSFDPAGAEGYFETPVGFSTYTRILDAHTGKELLRLEDVAVTNAGKPLDAKEAELWGVTFAGGDRYYATIATGGHHYLIRGAVGSSGAAVVRDRVECPAISPDGRRIAYKRRIGDSNKWRYHVLDLASGEDVALAEPRSIDDQPEWLGADAIVYSDDEAVFTVPADGTGKPTRLSRTATSPAFLSH